ncbi:hypothetical protein CHLRE_12g530876v5 [Chlamydomonas reinhardtii]|uniref:Uncharacterized protein n=1 Tax=Chlamydomonas reinhardtii TaxID=3055 RepID=A0A2K3D4T3_CHLRE|nr:uncharacterized protein CHLRE_12g530876v5 [Chlamydomonas reinhardtii]PNW75542.1 hypothetical protein CHLRE_12g530876v5 [Chlamydomonas reinhardtii]
MQVITGYFFLVEVTPPGRLERLDCHAGNGQARRRRFSLPRGQTQHRVAVGRAGCVV